jgi:hypothetical protein
MRRDLALPSLPPLLTNETQTRCLPSFVTSLRVHNRPSTTCTWRSRRRALPSSLSYLAGKLCHHSTGRYDGLLYNNLRYCAEMRAQPWSLGAVSGSVKSVALIRVGLVASRDRGVRLAFIDSKSLSKLLVLRRNAGLTVMLLGCLITAKPWWTLREDETGLGGGDARGSEGQVRAIGWNVIRRWEATERTEVRIYRRNRPQVRHSVPCKKLKRRVPPSFMKASAILRLLHPRALIWKWCIWSISRCKQSVYFFELCSRFLQTPA